MDANTKLFNAKKSELFQLLKDLLSSANSRVSIHPKQLQAIEELIQDESKFTYLAFSSQIPALTKHQIFGDPNYINPIIQTQLKKQIKMIPAAGTTGDLLSFRFHDPALETGQVDILRPLIESIFKIQTQNSIFINAYPTGISLPDHLNSVECSAKPEVFRLALKLFQAQSSKQDFPHIVICQAPFLKYCADHGYLTSEDFQKSYFLVGGTWYPKTLHSYLGYRLKLPTDEIHKRIASLFGIAEVGLGIGIQTPELAAYRDSLQSGPQTTAPMIYALDSSRFFMESVNGNLIITRLRADCPFPLLRYQTGDQGKLLNLPSSPERTFFSAEGRSMNPDHPYPILQEVLEERLCSQPDLMKNLSGNVKIGKDLITFETNRPLDEVGELEVELSACLQTHCKIRLVEKLTKKNQIQFDLFRKPRVYDS
jgi:hypothetical protein